MEKHRLAVIFLNTTQYLINYKSYPALFLLLASIEEINGFTKYCIHRRLAKVYPVLAGIVNNLAAENKLEEILSTIKSEDNEEQKLWQTMLWLNTEFINHIGCECGRKVFLFSDSAEENYNHHFHHVFRKWAYAHYSEKQRARLIIPVE